MTSITGSVPTTVHPSTTHVARPSTGRRAALAVVAFLNCALPTIFTINITRMLVTGELSDHRFHQATGQGLILFALWLLPILAMLRAGWQGRRPSAAAGYLHLVLIASGVVCAALAPGGGAPFLVGLIAATGALLWLALPQRPQLRGPVQIDPLLAPIALTGSALLLPYAVDQIGLQNAATGHHAHNPHFFDMAWIAVTLSCIAFLAALKPALRVLAGWFAASLVALGAAGIAFGESLTWSGAVLALGLVAGVAPRILRRRSAGN